MMLCAIVILNWNGVEMLRRYLPPLLQYTQVESVEIIIADNHSSDESIVFLQANYPQIRIMSMDSNRGFAGGYNEALKEVEAKYYLLLNSDVEVTAHWLLPLLSQMEADESVWACSPKLLDIYRRDYFEYAGASGGFIDYLGYPFCRGRIFDSIEKDCNQYNDSCEVHWATGAALMIRSEKFYELGGFDADYFAHMEEIDLCWRIWCRGGKVMIVPQSQVYHEGGASLDTSNPFKTYLNFRNNLSTLYKNTPGSGVVWLLILRIILDVLASIVFLIKGESAQAKAAIKGHLHFWKNIKMLSGKRALNNLSCIVPHPAVVCKKSIVWAYHIKKINAFTKYIRL